MFLTKSWILVAIMTGKVMGKDCYNKETKGTDYRGTKEVAASGNPCATWGDGFYAESYDGEITDFDDWTNEKFDELYGVDTAGTTDAYSHCRNPLPDKFGEPWCYTEAEYDFDDYTAAVIKREVCGVEICSDEDEDETKDDTDGETGEMTEVQEEYSSVSPRRPLFLLVALTLIVFINF